MTQAAWIVTDDEQLSAALRFNLHQHGVREAQPLTFSRWLQGAASSPCPHWVFFDFRREGAWQELSRLRHGCRALEGQDVVCVGIVEGGYPLAWARQAHCELVGVLPPEFRSEEVRKFIHEGRADAVGRDKGVSDGYELRAGAARFRTYTPRLITALEQLEKVASREVTILLVGETGAGKTTLARIIHERSRRCELPFLHVACGALAAELIDSELFGHVKGAFTGAERNRDGKFAAADGGTLLLDEVDVLGIQQQAKLLRVLETGEYELVGSNETRTSTARVIAASNVRLESLMERGEFRSDLYYRLNQVLFEIPPLRERPQDIVPLAIDFMEECWRESGAGANSGELRVAPELLDLLMAYSWPGNIRELRNEVRRAVMFSDNGLATADALSPRIAAEAAETRRKREEAAPVRSRLAFEIAKSEREAIEEMLRRHNNNRAAAARALGVSRVTLYSKLKKYRIV